MLPAERFNYEGWFKSFIHQRARDSGAPPSST